MFLANPSSTSSSIAPQVSWKGVFSGEWMNVYLSNYMLICGKVTTYGGRLCHHRPTTQEGSGEKGPHTTSSSVSYSFCKLWYLPSVRLGSGLRKDQSNRFPKVRVGVSRVFWHGREHGKCSRAIHTCVFIQQSSGAQATIQLTLDVMTDKNITTS